MKIENIINRANEFTDSLEISEGFKLFKRSETSAYARCFVIFIKYLLKKTDWIETRKEKLIYYLNIDLYELYLQKINNGINITYDKPFLQLFCFTLSSLNILNGNLNNKNLKILNELLDIDIIESLKKKSVDTGVGASGNHSMFIGIINIYANDYLKINRSQQIQEWIDFNSKSINLNGFWGKNKNMDYLQFQNGYHQYEIFEYLKFTNIPWSLAAKKTMLMADRYGHFAPYPGGGACYDYDATFMLTSKFVDDVGQKDVLLRTLNSITNEQNIDGGFCESRYVKKNMLPRIIKIINHILFQPSHIKIWSILSNLNLLRFKHRHIISYWTPTNRRWDESNAWDTFFRISTIKRICDYFNLNEKNLFETNEFPGIG